MKNLPWTKADHRKLRQAHAGAYPSPAELHQLFPDHSLKSVRSKASRLGLRQDGRHSFVGWLRIAHAHFARREAGLLT
jgi:hypothetical protein